MAFGFLKTRFILYFMLLVALGVFLFNSLLTRQSAIMYRYFIEKPSAYNLERAERLSTSIYNSFKKEVLIPSIENIEAFIKKYNDIPFLSVNFIYSDASGNMKSVVGDVKDIDILNAEYVYQIRSGTENIGTLLVYDINKEYKKGLGEYDHILNVTRVSFSFLLIFLLSIFIYREYSVSMEHRKRIAEYQAVHDGLTGMYTNKYFKEHLAQEMKKSRRSGLPLCLLMCDVDHFKRFNDTYGHLAGDVVLQHVARIIAENVRESDIVARYGGEEFAVILLDTGAKKGHDAAKRTTPPFTEESLMIAQRIKKKIETARVRLDSDTEVGVTMSVGLSFYTDETEHTQSSLVHEADQALYQSKNNGRNRITVSYPGKDETVEYV
ncbi:MAG: GGDEF domain-containing protein [Candidatus Omnitrophica bacterium]|nr:GGDEF domain-containing protein [Candidatus Omnitrophota bacterium]